MRLTARSLNRATLARQLLLERAPVSAVEAVRRIGAMQAQEPASPYIALWSRVVGFDPAALDAAFAEGAVVKASLMRITLHAVHADDYPALHRAMVSSLRASRVYDRRFSVSGLSVSDVDDALPDLLAFADRPRTKAHFEATLEARLGAGADRAWWALKTFAPLTHAPTGGPWSFGLRPAFVAAGTRLPEESRDEAVRHLIRRYLEAFGPASVADVAQFSLLARAVVRGAIATMASDLVEREAADGSPLFDVPGAALPDEDTPAPPRFLPMWDSTLLAYADRSRMIPAGLRRIVIRSNGDVLPTFLVDGHVAGVWRPVDGGIEATAFQRLPDDAWGGLDAEARALLAFLADRDPTVYRRYARWWSSLPGGEVRLLRG